MHLFISVHVTPEEAEQITQSLDDCGVPFSRFKIASCSTPQERELRELREAQGLTQHELAMRCGVSTSTINNIERGRHHPQARIWRKIQHGLFEASHEL